MSLSCAPQNSEDGKVCFYHDGNKMLSALLSVPLVPFPAATRYRHGLHPQLLGLRALTLQAH